jgi:hypothetical protein
LKILYVNFIHNLWGHKRLDEKLIKYLATFAEVTVISPRDWYKDLPSKINIITYNPKTYLSKKIDSKHFYSIKIMNFAARIKKKEKFDYIFAASFDTYAFAIGRFFFNNQNNLYIMHHNNTDSLYRNKVDIFFKSYVKDVNHVVFEKFISDYLAKKYRIKKDNILTLPHPLYKNNCNNNKKKIDCVGISNSNDENWINEIINLEKKNEILKRHGLSVVLRSESKTYDNGNLKVINGYLKKTKYNYYINNTNKIFLPFPKTFKYRMSGSLMDALSNNKIVLGSDIPLIKRYSQQYPKICYTVKNPKDFFEQIKNIKVSKDNKMVKHDFKEFNNAHSQQKITEILVREFS